MTSAVAILTTASGLVIPHNVDSIGALRGHREAAKGKSKDFAVAPFVTSETAAQNLVDDAYIIVFKDNIDPQTIARHHLFVDTVHGENVAALRKRGEQHALVSEPSGLKHVFSIGDSYKGYTGKFHPDTIEAIRRHEAVAFVEHDSRVFASEFDVEKNSPWGLARISHREPLSLGSFNKYLYDNEGGEGVTAYVVDTGTNVDHVDFEGRARWGKTVPANDVDIDGNGHGTHCSGTIAGAKYGVAKKATVVAVKVLGTNGSGSMSDVIKGIEFVVESHIKDAGKKGHKGSTANMSLGGGKSPSLDIAVNAAVKAGVHFSVAAGNDNADACNYSPAGADLAVTVGASALSDDRAYFSNFGKCVDIFAPGVNVLSTYIGSKHAVATLSGTSMASPHICGLLTYFLSLQPSSDSEFSMAAPITPAQLKKNLIAFGTEGVLGDLDADSPNVLAYNGGGQNLSSLWEHSTSHTEEATFSILPVEEQIKDELNHVIEEVNDIFEDLRAGLGFHF